MKTILTLLDILALFWSHYPILTDCQGINLTGYPLT